MPKSEKAKQILRRMYTLYPTEAADIKELKDEEIILYVSRKYPAVVRTVELDTRFVDNIYLKKQNIPRECFRRCKEIDDMDAAMCKKLHRRFQYLMENSNEAAWKNRPKGMSPKETFKWIKLNHKKIWEQK